MEGRFIVRDEWHSCDLFALPENEPWPTLPSGRPPLLRVGWRCVATLSNLGSIEFPRDPAAISPMRVDGHDVQVAFADKRRGDNYSYFVIDIWTERQRSNDLAEAILRCSAAMEQARKVCESALGCWGDKKLVVREEFLDVRLPRLMAHGLNSDHVRAAIRANLRSMAPLYPDELQTVSLRDRRLRIGPESSGIVEAFRSFLKDLIGDTPREAGVPTENLGFRKWIPLFMAGAMILSWGLPLAWWSIAVFAVVHFTLAAWLIWPSKDIGLRKLFRQSGVLISTGIFGIGAFGLAYAVCALVSDEALGHVSRLGYPFLVSTGLGVAGGILGDNPRGAARIIAHIQLLIFLGGLAAIAAVILRIDRATRNRG